MPQTWIFRKLFNILALWINITGIFWYHPQGWPQAQKGVGKWSPEALACTVLMPQPWIFGKLFNILALWINIIGIFCYHLQGQLQTHEGVGILRPEALACWVLMPQPWILGELLNILALWLKIIDIFWYLQKIRGSASDSRKCWKIEAWGPGNMFCYLNHEFWGSCSTC